MTTPAPLPPPPVPPDVDLRGFPFMPLDVQRLRDSDFAIASSAEGFRAGVLLWCAAWHQVPAASLPSDDRLLANLAGFGRDVAGWQLVREEALRGFAACSDGRLYHHVIAAKALDAWTRKLAERERKSAAGKKGAAARWGQDDGTSHSTSHNGCHGTTMAGNDDKDRDSGEGQGDGEGHHQGMMMTTTLGGVRAREAVPSEPQEVAAVIEAFEAAGAKVFGSKRPSRHPDDVRFARQWAGADMDHLAWIFECEMREWKRRRNRRPAGLSAIRQSVEDARRANI